MRLALGERLPQQIGSDLGGGRDEFAVGVGEPRLGFVEQFQHDHCSGSDGKWRREDRLFPGLERQQFHRTESRGVESFTATGSWKLIALAASERANGTVAVGSCLPSAPYAVVDSTPSFVVWRTISAPSVAPVTRITNRRSDFTASGKRHRDR